MTRSNRWRAVAWGTVLAALVVGFVVGGQPRTSGTTPAQRAAALDAQLRCPSCEDLSVAQSQAVSAVAIRTLVAQRTAAGESDAAIVGYLQARYPGIVLRPPATGLASLVWWVPVGAVAVAVAALGMLGQRRWGRGSGAGAPPSDADAELVAGALAQRARAGVP